MDWMKVSLSIAWNGKVGCDVVPICTRRARWREGRLCDILSRPSSRRSPGSHPWKLSLANGIQQRGAIGVPVYPQHDWEVGVRGRRGWTCNVEVEAVELGLLERLVRNTVLSEIEELFLDALELRLRAYWSVGRSWTGAGMRVA